MSTIAKNLGHATAYGYYKAGGGTMTEEEFTEYMADFGTAAQTAVDAATSAQQSATAAAGSATNAGASADSAAGSAGEASGSATAASGSADAAASSATAASGSASAAAGSAEAAAGSATSAGTAQTAAESARDAAVAAKNAAVSAQGASETARDASVSAKNDAVSAKETAVSAKDAAVSAQTAAETAQGLAEDAQEAAESARDAAVTAKNASVSAKDDAVTAKTAAEAAQTGAETARTGSESAQTGAEAAQAAAESARDTALSAKNDAVSAKTAAQSAQTAAESAQTAAETAQTAAESAQTGAEAAQAAAESAVNTILEDRICVDFIAARTGRVWKRKVWKTATNTTPECPAIDDYDDGVATPFTDDVAGSDPYMDKYRVFQWMHCNYVRDEDGTARPVALEGDSNYATTGSVDVGTLRPTFWWKWEDTDSTYFTLYFSDSPHEELGLVPWRDAVKLNGTVLPYFIVSSYPSITASDGKLRSQPGKPANNASYNNIISKYQAKGSGYWGSGSSIMTLAIIDLIVKYKTKLEQNVSKGNSQFNVSEAVLVAESGVKRVLVSASSTKFSRGDGVTVGTASDAYWLNGNVVSWAEIKSVETVNVDGTDYKAIYLDIANTIDTTTSMYIVGSACPSGQTDAVMGHYDGALISNTDNKHSFRIGGVELMNGLWFVFADTVIDFLSNSWRVYVAPKGTAHVSGAHTNYKLIGTSSAFTGDAYVGNVSFDEETGGFYHAEAGTGSSVGTGAHHWNGGTSVTDGTLREWLGVGALAHGANVGFAACSGWYALSDADANIGSRD